MRGGAGGAVRVQRRRECAQAVRSAAGTGEKARQAPLSGEGEGGGEARGGGSGGADGGIDR